MNALYFCLSLWHYRLQDYDLIIATGIGCLTGFPSLDSVTSHSCPSPSCTTEGDPSDRQLRLFPTMIISCTGTLQGLTVVGFFGFSAGGVYPTLQIWRPISMMDSTTVYTQIPSGAYDFPRSSDFFTILYKPATVHYWFTNICWNGWHHWDTPSL